MKTDNDQDIFCMVSIQKYREQLQQNAGHVVCPEEQYFIFFFINSDENHY